MFRSLASQFQHKKPDTSVGLYQSMSLTQRSVLVKALSGAMPDVQATLDPIKPAKGTCSNCAFADVPLADGARASVLQQASLSGAPWRRC